MSLALNKSITMYSGFDNSTFTTSQQENKRLPIISDRSMFYIDVLLNFVVCGGLGVFGTINNVFNMRVFHKMGVHDSMNIGLMALSLADLLYSLLSVFRTIFFTWGYVSPNSYLNPRAMFFISFAWWRDIVFLCSVWITSFLSVERCVCVIFPFKVKAIFTSLTTIMSLVIICAVNVVVHLPIIFTQRIGWSKVAHKTDNGTTVTDQLVLMFSKNRFQIQVYIDVVNGSVLPIPAQVLVLVSVVWMIHGLRESSRVRKTMTMDKDHNSNRSNLSPKERRLVKVVLLLALILTFCNIPRFLAVNAKHISPEMSYGNFEHNFYLFLWLLSNVFTSISSSFNIFIYLTVNVSYRNTFRDLFVKKTNA